VAARDVSRVTRDRLDARPRNRHAGGVDESQQWVEFGRWLVEQREQRGLRRRDAARRAKVSETLWRDLETGRKEAIGAIRLLPNPSADVLERVAAALELPVEDVLARIGRPARQQRPSSVPRSGSSPAEDDGSLLGVKLRRLSERDRALVERLVDGMLELEDRG
jgi:transcriptional regulator with XRE-family HTH domain